MSILHDVAERMPGSNLYDNYVAAVCIFHSDNSPSLMIHEDTYKCLACGAFGSTTKLLAKLRNTEILHQPEIVDDDVIKVYNPFYRWLKKSDLKMVLHSGWEFLNKHPEMGTYITQDRQILPENRQKLGIGYLDGFYTFPITDERGCIAGAFVRAPVGANRRYFVPKGQSPNLLYIPFRKLLQSQGVVFMTFGVIDAISIAQLGFASSSTIDGKQIDVHSLDHIRKFVVILPDDGEEKEAMVLANRLGWRGKVHSLNYPCGCKDANEYYRKDEKALSQELQNIVKGLYQ